MPHRDLSSFYLLAAKVRDSTRQRYKAAVDDFIMWCEDNGIEVNSRSDLDWELCEYIHDEYERNDGRGRTHMANTIFGLQLFVPQVRGHLRLSAQALMGWKARHPGQRHPPLTWDLSVAIAAQLARWGRFDMAVATLLAFSALLRIGELVALRVEDFLDAKSDDPRVDTARISGLRLRKTKTAENLFAELHTESVIQLMRVLTANKQSAARIFQFSAGTFRKWFKKAVVSLQLDHRYVPHSLRHGGATTLYMSGVPIETILHRGRWASTKSARYYVQSGEALLLGQAPNRRARDLGRDVAADLVRVLSLLRRQNPIPVRAAPSYAKKAAAYSPAKSVRHSTRHDWQVRPDYASLDEWSLPPPPPCFD